MVGHLVFNGYDFGERFFCHVPKRIMPESQITEQEIGGRSGAYFQSRKLMPVDLDCVLVLKGPKLGHERMVGILDEVAAHLKPNQGRLYLPTDDQRYYIATPNGMGEVDEFVSSARLRIAFRASDPIKYGAEHSFDLPAGSATVVRAGGNHPTKPTFTATATAGNTYYRARNTTKNVNVYLYPNKLNTSEAWNGGEQIVVDMEAEKATVNGQIWPVSLSSSYFEHEGTEKLYSNEASTITWKERWL